MGTQAIDFNSLSVDVAKKFLRSVLVVDDKAYEPPDYDAPDEKVSDLQPPEPVLAADAEVATIDNSNKELIKPTAAGATPQAPDVHALSVKAFSDSFAEIGMFCTVLKPSPDEVEKLMSTATEENGLANRADVVILDWVLHSYKEGEKTLELIEQLVGPQADSKQRTRLILIYTGESDLFGIANKIRQKLNLQAIDNPGNKEATEIRTRAATIVVYAKPGVKVIEQLQSLVVSAEQIPAIVVNDFANSTMGLVSNLALQSMAVLRSETYDILKKFPKSLDAAFVTHKVLKNPEDAAGHILPLVVSEIQAVLEDNNVTETVSEAAIATWLEHRINKGLRFNLPNTTEAQARLALLDLLKKSPSAVADNADTHGRFVQNFLKSKNKAKKEVVGRLTDLLSGQAGSHGNEQLAVLMSVRSRYGTPPPRLSLGTIIREVETNRYLICVQPRCDSVRLKGARQFPFLPMNAVTADYQFIVPNEDAFATLTVSGDPYQIEMIPFQPWSQAEGEVLARPNNARLFFKSREREASFQWIAELKTEHALRLAVRLSNKISRVGLNESEWLRFIARASDDDEDNA